MNLNNNDEHDFVALAERIDRIVNDEHGGSIHILSSHARQLYASNMRRCLLLMDASANVYHCCLETLLDRLESGTAVDEERQLFDKHALPRLAHVCRALCLRFLLHCIDSKRSLAFDLLSRASAARSDQDDDIILFFERLSGYSVPLCRALFEFGNDDDDDDDNNNEKRALISSFLIGVARRQTGTECARLLLLLAVNAIDGDALRRFELIMNVFDGVEPLPLGAFVDQLLVHVSAASEDRGDRIVHVCNVVVGAHRRRGDERLAAAFARRWRALLALVVSGNAAGTAAFELLVRVLRNLDVGESRTLASHIVASIFGSLGRGATASPCDALAALLCSLSSGAASLAIHTFDAALDLMFSLDADGVLRSRCAVPQPPANSIVPLSFSSSTAAAIDDDGDDAAAAPLLEQNRDEALHSKRYRCRSNRKRQRTLSREHASNASDDCDANCAQFVDALRPLIERFASEFAVVLLARITPTSVAPTTERQYADMLPKAKLRRFARDNVVFQFVEQNPIVLGCLHALLSSAPLAQLDAASARSLYSSVRSLLWIAMELWRRVLPAHKRAERLYFTRRLLDVLVRAQWIPRPLCHASLIFDIVDAAHTSQLLSAMWRYLTDFPPHKDRRPLANDLDAYTSLLTRIVHDNLASIPSNQLPLLLSK
jgi:hypothetical protein